MLLRRIIVSEHDRDDPVVWMLLLERGRREGNFELAACAKRELARLGIRVSYARRTQFQKAKVHHG